MDTNRSLSSYSGALEEVNPLRNACSGSYWTRCGDKVPENALAFYHNATDPWGKFVDATPGKTIGNAKLHGEALRADVEAIESGELPFPLLHPSSNWVCEKKERPLRIGGKQGRHQKDEEHCGKYWTKQEDKEVENAPALFHDDADLQDKIAVAVPGKSPEELKLHYGALRDDVEAIEYGTHYSRKNGAHKKKPLKIRVKPVRWTNTEHRSFLCGLEKFGRGDWTSISRYCVTTKTNTQVASHAQKYFKGLYSGKRNRKGSGINSAPTLYPDRMSSSEKQTATGMPEYLTPALTSSGKPLLSTSFYIISNPPCPTHPIFESGTSAEGMSECSLSDRQPIEELPKPTPFPLFPVMLDALLSAASSDFTLEAGMPARSMFSLDFPSDPIRELHHPMPSVRNDAASPLGSSNVPSTSDAMDLDMGIFALPKIIDIN